MSANSALWIGAGVAIAALLALWAIVRHLHGEACEIPATSDLWSGRSYACPDCATAMEAGWVMLGKGAIWSSREKGPPGPFAHIGSALPNTISLSLRPAANMAWRCPSCRLLLIDHSKLVKPAGWGGTA
ncbi:PF20097 family protein [Thiocapsa sp.]|uniref:PF20097 family protein n=1 Tax=Thiocapsa sp. TaxID=2024551 RepID=UPI0035941C42